MKEFYVSLIVIITVTASFANLPPTIGPCVPIAECPLENHENYTVHVPNKADCHTFYKCNSKCGYLMECPVIPGTNDRLVFNPKWEVCDWPNNVPGACSGETPSTPSTPSTPTTTPTTTSTTTPSTPSTPTRTPSTPTTPTTTPSTPPTTPPTSVPNCNIAKQCPEKGTTSIIHEWDCQRYYVCRNGVKSKESKSCQQGHIFNPFISVCDKPENVSCYRPC